MLSEDKLQENVPSAIANLRAAGIIVWVLTGDKQETAINIAYSCKLFNEDSKVIIFNAKTEDEARELIESNLEKMETKKSSDDHYAIVVDSKTITFIFDQTTNLQDKFLKLSQYCGSVLACRATPLQKSTIVVRVKEDLEVVTMAIGIIAESPKNLEPLHSVILAAFLKDVSWISQYRPENFKKSMPKN